MSEFKHGASCCQSIYLTLKSPTLQFRASREQFPDFCMTVMTLGTVVNGYGSVRGATKSMPWVAHPHIPFRFGLSADIGPFRTQGEALQGLQDWWFKRLGVEV